MLGLLVVFPGEDIFNLFGEGDQVGEDKLPLEQPVVQSLILLYDVALLFGSEVKLLQETLLLSVGFEVNAVTGLGMGSSAPAPHPLLLSLPSHHSQKLAPVALGARVAVGQQG